MDAYLNGLKIGMARIKVTIVHRLCFGFTYYASRGYIQKYSTGKLCTVQGLASLLMSILFHQLSKGTKLERSSITTNLFA